MNSPFHPVGLDYKLKIQPYRGKTIREVLLTNPLYIDKLKEGGLKLNTVALCALINARSAYYERLGKSCDKAREGR